MDVKTGDTVLLTPFLCQYAAYVISKLLIVQAYMMTPQHMATDAMCYGLLVLLTHWPHY